MQSTQTSFDARLKASRCSWRAKASAEPRLRVLSVLLFAFMLVPRGGRRTDGGAPRQHLRRVSCDTAGSTRGDTRGAVFRQ
jgi:hypothetical protein